MTWNRVEAAQAVVKDRTARASMVWRPQAVKLVDATSPVLSVTTSPVQGVSSRLSESSLVVDRALSGGSYDRRFERIDRPRTMSQPANDTDLDTYNTGVIRIEHTG